MAQTSSALILLTYFQVSLAFKIFTPPPPVYGNLEEYDDYDSPDSSDSDYYKFNERMQPVKKASESKKNDCTSPFEEYRPNGNTCDESCHIYKRKMDVFRRISRTSPHYAEFICVDEDRASRCYCKKGLFRLSSDGRCVSAAECLFN